MANYGVCSECRTKGQIHIHHIDGDHTNDIPENRVVLCPSCHRQIHIEGLITSSGRPSTQPISERVFDMPGLSSKEIKMQYLTYFPRA